VAEVLLLAYGVANKGADLVIIRSLTLMHWCDWTCRDDLLNTELSVPSREITGRQFQKQSSSDSHVQ
jgi:hypothetical protein